MNCTQKLLQKKVKLKQLKWDLDIILPLNYKLPKYYTDSIDPNRHQNFTCLLSRDVYSEGDSQPLYDYLFNQSKEYTVEFQEFLSLWIEDEIKHYQALRRVYKLISKIKDSEIDKSFNIRNHEIEPLKFIFKDEFTILVSFLFDELGSTISYRRDLREYYSHYGPRIQRIAKYLVMDEGMHFQNASQVIKQNHYKRIYEIPIILEMVSSLERSLGRYCKTFFLDHAQEQDRFPCNFNDLIIEIILAHFNLGPYPKNADLLWQSRVTNKDFTPCI